MAFTQCGWQQVVGPIQFGEDRPVVSRCGVEVVTKLHGTGGFVPIMLEGHSSPRGRGVVGGYEGTRTLEPGGQSHQTSTQGVPGVLPKKACKNDPGIFESLAGRRGPSLGENVTQRRVPRDCRLFQHPGRSSPEPPHQAGSWRSVEDEDVEGNVQGFHGGDGPSAAHMDTTAVEIEQSRDDRDVVLVVFRRTEGHPVGQDVRHQPAQALVVLPKDDDVDVVIPRNPVPLPNGPQQGA